MHTIISGKLRQQKRPHGDIDAEPSNDAQTHLLSPGNQEHQGPRLSSKHHVKFQVS